MKLLIVTQTLDRNDPILGFFHRWVEELAKKFDSIHVIALNVGSHALSKNVKVHTLGKELGMERLPRILRYVALLIRLRREYTHVFAHMNPEYVIGGGWLWRLLGKKVGFWYVHGAVSKRLKLAIFFAHRVFTASPESCRVKSKKVTVVGHGIDTDLFSPKDVPHPPSLITTGRLSPSKHLETLISAYTQIKKTYPKIGFAVVGSAGSPEEKKYADEILAKAQAAGVTVMPPVANHDIPALLAKSDIFLSASETGSLDKAVLEAMSAGVVPVASNIAYKSMLEPLALYVGDSPDLFAVKCLELIDDTPKRQRLAHVVREEIVSHHSLIRLVDKLRTVYAAL